MIESLQSTFGASSTNDLSTRASQPGVGLSTLRRFLKLLCKAFIHGLLVQLPGRNQQVSFLTSLRCLLSGMKPSWARRTASAGGMLSRLSAWTSPETKSLQCQKKLRSCLPACRFLISGELRIPVLLDQNSCSTPCISISLTLASAGSSQTCVAMEIP